MELYDLRNGYIRPKDFENIIDPLTAKRRVKESYHLEKTVGGMIGSLNGYMLKKNDGLRSYYSYDLYDRANWSKLDNDIDNENKEIISKRSVFRRYGEQREIPQRYLESDDVWAAEGKSWHWIPTISDECYEFKK